MPLASSNGPRWIRSENAAGERRRRGLWPVVFWLASLFRRRR